MLMVYNLLLFIIMHCICKVSTELFVPGLEEVSPFTDMAQEHDTFCARVSHDCSMRTGPEVESYCCGTCTCDSFCHAHGSCCLSAYGSFEQARISVQKSRYSCVLSKFLQGWEDTDYLVHHVPFYSNAYWMITKCDPDLLDTTNTCETDVSDYDSLVPVTDPLTNVHYMSKNCALCNLKNSSAPLLYWKLGVQSNKHMSFPHTQLFEEILRTRGNIFYIPHDYLPIQICEPASYSIDTCNVTGLWETYDESVQMACESFVDPFNNTYKNIFCLKCNGEVDLMSEECRYTLDIPTTKEPLFAAVLDLPTIRSGFDTTALRCGDAQFRDEITMTCRDVLCHENGQLDSGVCVSVGASFVDTCSSIFLKLTPVPGQRQLRKRFIQTSYFLMNFLREIGVNNQDNNEGTTDSGVWTTSSVSYSSNEFGPERFERSAESYGVLQKLRIFFKTEKHNYIHYIVVQLINHFKDTKQKYEFLDNIKPFMILYYNGELSARFSIELTSFKFNSIDDRTTVSVPRNAGKEVDELVSDFDAIYGLECDSDTITELTKIQRCPYVILDLKGITMRVNNDVITVFDNGEIPRILKVFSKWEYENHNGSLYICFQDYLDIYYSSFSKIAHKTMVADSPKIISNVWLDLVYLLLTFICI